MDMEMDSYFLHEYEEGLFYGRYQDPGNPEETTWEQVFDRVANAIGTNPEQVQRFSRMMRLAMAIPSSPQIWNYGSGRRNPWQGSSCFTGYLGDSIPDFLTADQHAHEVYMASGGYGVLANDVRPRGCKISYSKSRSVGAMGMGGPVRKLEKTTGYITNGGRDRGALMVQLSAWHPDAIEFALSMLPISLGFLDDWPANAVAMIGDVTPKILAVIDLFTRYAHRKEWPRAAEIMDDLQQRDATDALGSLIAQGIIKEDEAGHLVPQVFDWYLGPHGGWREANRNWDLPLQNCNISIRVPDALVHAAMREDNWVFSWSSNDHTKDGSHPWILTDALSNHLEEIEDGRVAGVEYTNDDVRVYIDYPTSEDEPSPRYSVILTTWEGLKENLKPNPNNWKDVEYARFFREVLTPRLEHLTGVIKAREVLDLFFEAAWESADPGIVFEDTYEKFNPVDSNVYGVRLSNPCSEFVNPPDGSCNLISLNVRWCCDQSHSLYTTDGLVDVFGDRWSISGLSTPEDWRSLRDTAQYREFMQVLRNSTEIAFEYISEAHEKNVAPVDRIHQASHDVYRTVGVGVMGLAEALMTFHVAYGSECGQHMAAGIMAEVYATCWEESFRLAMEENWPKPEAWNQDRMIAIFTERVRHAIQYDLGQEIIDRLQALVNRTRAGQYATNTCVTSVAPTGTISQIAGWLMTREASNGIIHDRMVTSSGEPPFGWSVFRRDNSGENQIAPHDLWANREHTAKPWMKTASDTTPAEHVEMQAALCAFCCMSVSKTINLPRSATVQDVADGYLLAWELGVPGTSLYRDRSKPMQVLTALDCPSGDCASPIHEMPEAAEVADAK